MYAFPALFAATLFLSACSKSEPVKEDVVENISTPAVLATLTTTAFSSITTTSASTGGSVTNNGGAAVTDRGVCYSLSPNPTIANFTVSPSSTSGSGSFVAQMGGYCKCDFLPPTHVHCGFYVGRYRCRCAY